VANTIGDVYLFLKSLGYPYPKFLLKLGEQKLDERYNTMKLSEFLTGNGEVLTLVDPPILGALLVGGALGGLIGYEAGKGKDSSSK